MYIKKYEIELTSNCNAECPMCTRTQLGFKLNGNATLSIDDIKKIFPTKKHIYNKQFDLCGVLGDPIVAPDCMEVCEYFSRMGAKGISISTNGGYNTADWWKKLATIPNLVVSWAVDGHADTNHIYRVNVNWTTVKRNMQAYCSAGGKGTWKFLAFAHNENDVTLAKKLAKEFGLEFVVRTGRIHQLLQNKVHTPRRSRPVNLTTSSKYVHAGNLEEHKKITTDIFDENIDGIVSALPSISCKHLNEGYAFVASDLTLWPCCYLYDRAVKGNEYMHAYTTDLGADENWNSLKAHTIDQITSHSNFVDIQNFWHPTHKKYLPSCLGTCGAAGARLNKNQNNK